MCFSDVVLSMKYYKIHKFWAIIIQAGVDYHFIGVGGTAIGETIYFQNERVQKFQL